jgi:bacterioferritin-associated ferredoxin
LIVCQCQAVNDRTVALAIEDGARTVDEIGERCRAGTDCTGCHPELERLLCERASRLAGAGASR